MDTKKLRQKILDLAIHGKLVPQDPNDEPASVLLERIRAEKEQLIKDGKIKKSRKTSSSSDTPHYENVPFEVPQGWVWTTGNDIFMPLKSCIPQGDVFMYVDIDAIDNKRNIITNPKRIPTKHAPSRATRYIQAGDTLFSMVRPYLRNIACVQQNGWIASTGFYVCSPTKLITQEYCYYLMLSDYVVNGLNQFMKGDNSPSINNGHITSWLYPVPPLEEQSRIVEEIEHWFTLVDLIEQGKANLDNTIQKAKNKILDLAIHGRLVPQDPNDEPAIELLKRINPNFIPCDNAQYGKLPDRWCLTKLGAIGRWQSGGTPSRANSEYYVGDIPWLKIADLQDGYVKEYSEKISNEAICNSSAKINPEGSIALAMYGSIGKLGILTFPAATNQAICVCSSFMGVDAKYLFFFLMSQRDDFVLKAGGGVQANISKEIIINHRIAIPPLPEQLRIVSKIENLFSLLNNIESSLQA